MMFQLTLADFENPATVLQLCIVAGLVSNR